MEIMRLVVTGPVGAGKSTFIRSISEIEVVDTDQAATDETAQLKERTTVAFDFGRLQFGPEMALHLYGTPGQVRFDFMWDILIKQAHAYIVLVAADRPMEFLQARRIMTFMRKRRTIPMIIGLTHVDCDRAWKPENVAIVLGYPNPETRPPIIQVNANETASVARAVLSLVRYSFQNKAASHS
ncbi:GTP-binding protein [Vacuolonema iberomarrocanum]|uniref:GTP-binding protein n=1 Tax=Vacuolonema iberomarrocanum TaxID=3454632 RepID=UPI0019EBF7C8|nr:ATP/GTP-binding protein [filamentous cyanobacterium LEGE 07170]